MERYNPAQMCFLPESPHTITNKNDITHMDNTEAGSVNTRSKMTNIYMLVGQIQINWCIILQELPTRFGLGCGVQCHFQQYFSYIWAVRFISGGNRRTGENYRLVAGYWQTMYSIHLGTSGIHNVSGETLIT
jgi:hypothetical protein